MTQLDLFAPPPVVDDEPPAVQRIPFADCRVPAASVRDFISRYYRGDRLHGIEREIPGYVETVVSYHERYYAAQGFTLIGRHESTVGQPVAWPLLVSESEAIE